MTHSAEIAVPNPWQELIDLWIDDDALPEHLRAQVDAYLAAHPEAARDAHTLRDVHAQLKSITPERPDPWFVERALDSALHEHAAATVNSPILTHEINSR